MEETPQAKGNLTSAVVSDPCDRPGHDPQGTAGETGVQGLGSLAQACLQMPVSVRILNERLCLPFRLRASCLGVMAKWEPSVFENSLLGIGRGGVQGTRIALTSSRPQHRHQRASRLTHSPSDAQMNEEAQGDRASSSSSCSHAGSEGAWEVGTGVAVPQPLALPSPLPVTCTGSPAPPAAARGPHSWPPHHSSAFSPSPA